MKEPMKIEVGFSRLSPLDLLDLLPDGIIGLGFNSVEGWVDLAPKDGGITVRALFVPDQRLGLKILDSGAPENVTSALLELFESKVDHGPESAELHTGPATNA